MAKLIAALMKHPLPGYARIPMNQVLRADLVCWRLLSESTRSGIKRDENGNLPCEAALTAAMQDGDFIQALMPLPSRDHGSNLPVLPSTIPLRPSPREVGSANVATPPTPNAARAGRATAAQARPPKVRLEAPHAFPLLWSGRPPLFPTAGAFATVSPCHPVAL